MAIGWVARATCILFIPGRIDKNWVVEGAYYFIIGALALIHSFIHHSLPQAMRQEK